MPPVPECDGAGDGGGGASPSHEGRDARRAAGTGGGDDLRRRRCRDRARGALPRGRPFRDEHPQECVAHGRLPGTRSVI